MEKDKNSQQKVFTQKEIQILRKRFPGASMSSYLLEENKNNIIFISRNTQDPKETIPCIYYEYSEGSSGFLLYFKGNGMGMLDCDYLKELQQKIKVHIIVMEYASYGIYKTNKICKYDPYFVNFDRVAEDALIVYDFFVSKGVKENQIISYGCSIGTNAALCIAKYRKPGAVILNSGWSKRKEFYGEIEGEKEVHNEELIISVECPTLILHGDRDDFFPVEQAKINKEKIKEGVYSELHIREGYGHCQMIANNTNDNLTEEFLKNAKFSVENKEEMKIDMKEYQLKKKNHE